jgi:hypothetical protein
MSRMRRFWQEFDWAMEALRVMLGLTALITLIVYAR